MFWVSPPGFIPYFAILGSISKKFWQSLFLDCHKLSYVVSKWQIVDRFHWPAGMPLLLLENTWTLTVNSTYLVVLENTSCPTFQTRKTPQPQKTTQRNQSQWSLRTDTASHSKSSFPYKSNMATKYTFSTRTSQWSISQHFLPRSPSSLQIIRGRWNTASKLALTYHTTQCPTTGSSTLSAARILALIRAAKMWPSRSQDYHSLKLHKLFGSAR